MKLEQFEKEKHYAAMLAIAKKLHAREFITLLDYQKIKKMLTLKYLPAICSLLDSAPSQSEKK